MELNYEGLSKLRQLMLLVNEGIVSEDIKLETNYRSHYDGHIVFNMLYPLHQYACGTVACAGGWSRLAGICVDSWKEIVVSGEVDHTDRDVSLAESWLFNGWWATIAPTPLDVVCRIDYLVSMPKLFKMPTCHEWDSLWQVIKDRPIDVVPECLAGYGLGLTLEDLLKLARSGDGNIRIEH